MSIVASATNFPVQLRKLPIPNFNVWKLYSWLLRSRVLRHSWVKNQHMHILIDLVSSKPEPGIAIAVPGMLVSFLPRDISNLDNHLTFCQRPRVMHKNLSWLILRHNHESCSVAPINLQRPLHPIGMSRVSNRLSLSKTTGMLLNGALTCWVPEQGTGYPN